MVRLFEICNDCNHENYLSEIFIPLFRMCCCDNTKIVPVFDDRKTGPKTENETEAKNRIKTICALKEDGDYVVPDYLYVTKEYSFYSPEKPILMIETKKPLITYKKDKSAYYCELSISDYEQQLLAEVRNCEPVIFTDGITWMFLKEENGCVTCDSRFGTISLLNLGDDYYNYRKIVNASEVISGWDELKKRINQILISKTLM